MSLRQRSFNHSSPKDVRNWYSNLDFVSLLLWVGLMGIGLAAIYSTTHGPASEFLLDSVRNNYNRQLQWMMVAGIGFVVALLLPVRFYQYAAFPIYLITIVLLVAALLFGREINGARSWLSVGGIQIQVSELAKLGTVMGVAQLIGIRRPKSMGIQFGMLIVGMIMLPAVLVVLQNDTGTALVFFGLIPVVLFWSGLEFDLILIMIAPAIAGYLAIVFLPGAIAFAVIFTAYMFWHSRDRNKTIIAAVFSAGTVLAATVALTSILQPHQVARVRSFTDPGAKQYRLAEGYHQVQSMAAIGSGGFSGKGFMQGTQTKGAYIPEQSTDFVFSVIGEEFGFLGSLVVLLLFLGLLTRIIVLGSRMKHPFGVTMAAGTVGVYLIHILINIGMVTALLPVIGIPLPFLSYGGSALVANSALLSVVLALYLRRDELSIYGY